MNKITNIRHDTATGKIIGWVENGASYTVTRDSVTSKPTKISAVEKGPAVSMSFIYDSTGALVEVDGNVPSSLTHSVIDEAATSGNLILPAQITLTGSPFTYKNATTGVQQILISGGTVSAVQFSRDGTNFYTGNSNLVVLSPGDSVKITYSAAPTVYKVPVR